MTIDELNKIEKEILKLEAEGKKISVSNKMRLKKLQRKRDKVKSPIEPSSVFVPNSNISDNIQLVNIDKIIMPNFNDRTGIDNQKIIELAQSIKDNGLIQPIILKENSDGTYTKIAGRRRILAVKHNGKLKIEAIVRKENLDKNRFNLLVLHENTQREDLSNYDKVRSILHFIEQEFMLNQEEARKICYKANNYKKGNLVKENKELEIISNRLDEILAKTKVFSSLSHFIKHLPVLDMSSDILALLESNQITFGMALLFNQFSNEKFIDGKDFSTIIEHIVNKQMNIKDAKIYIINNLLKNKKQNEKKITKDIKKKLSKLNKVITLLDEEKQIGFNSELDKLLDKYKI